MNKKALAILTGIIMSVAAMPALAQEAGADNMAPPPPSPEEQAQAPMPTPEAQAAPQQDPAAAFETLKAGILAHLKQAEDCVSAATDATGLRPCMKEVMSSSSMMMGGGRPMMRRGGMGGGDAAPPPPAEGQ